MTYIIPTAEYYTYTYISVMLLCMLSREFLISSIINLYICKLRIPLHSGTLIPLTQLMFYLSFFSQNSSFGDRVKTRFMSV